MLNHNLDRPWVPEASISSNNLVRPGEPEAAQALEVFPMWNVGMESSHVEPTDVHHREPQRKEAWFIGPNKAIRKMESMLGEGEEVQIGAKANSSKLFEKLRGLMEKLEDRGLVFGSHSKFRGCVPSALARLVVSEQGPDLACRDPSLPEWSDELKMTQPGHRWKGKRVLVMWGDAFLSFRGRHSKGGETTEWSVATKCLDYLLEKTQG